MTTDRLRHLAIFRLQLFKPSETFIAAQASQLRRHRPIYVGRKLFGDPGRARVILPEQGRIGMLRQVLLRDMSGYDALTAERPALIHAHFAIDAVYALPLVRRLGVPLVTTLHGFDVTRTDAALLRSGSPAWINGVVFRRALQRRGAVFLCVSEFIRQAALARGFPEEKLRLHYIGIDTADIAPREGTGEDGLIVHVARLVEKKGTIYLLQALARIAPRLPAARLAIIGDGPLRAALEAEAARLGIADRVSFLGMRPNAEVLDWDARAAVKAVPSITAADGDREGLPTVITETAARGVPVVGFDSGGIAEAVVHGQTGLLAPERDVAGLAAHLERLLSDASLREVMGRAARARAESEFDIARQTAKLEDIYDDVCRSAR